MKRQEGVANEQKRSFFGAECKEGGRCSRQKCTRAQRKQEKSEGTGEHDNL
jgi:hypothetical protein